MSHARQRGTATAGTQDNQDLHAGSARSIDCGLLVLVTEP